MESIQLKEVKKIAGDYVKNINATDTRFNRDLSLILNDGTTMFLRNAFFVKLNNWFIIITEHNGLLCYDEDDVISCIQYERVFGYDEIHEEK